jgi:hypothetical protein
VNGASPALSSATQRIDAIAEAACGWWIALAGGFLANFRDVHKDALSKANGSQSASLPEPDAFVRLVRPYFQVNRISKQSQEAVEVGVVPSSPLELSAHRAFGSLLLHGVERHMTEDGEVVWSIAQSSSVLILVHDNIEPPVKAILHSPMLADNFVESF